MKLKVVIERIRKTHKETAAKKRRHSLKLTHAPDINIYVELVPALVHFPYDDCIAVK